MGLFSKTIEEEADERGKVFAWAKDRRVWMHLSAFLLFSVIIHGAGFYLFKVVYPSPVRVEPAPDAIQVMEPGEPAARAPLHRGVDGHETQQFSVPIDAPGHGSGRRAMNDGGRGSRHDASGLAGRAISASPA